MRRDHRLGALRSVAAEDTVDIAGRPREHLLDQKPIRLAGGNRQADRFEKGLRRKIERLPLRQNVRRQILHAIIESRDRDAAVVFVQFAENARQHADRILRRATEQSGMQVAIGGGDPHLVVDQTA